jgi:ligand-binding sensor domain-containing protein
MKHRLTGWIFGLLSFAVTGQTPSYMHYSVRDGLPGNLVYCGLQDHRGLLWFGTDKGLASFDGIRFTIYGIEDNLPDPEVLSMKEDREGRLWIFCFQKDPCYMLNGRIVTGREDSLLAKIHFKYGLANMYQDKVGGIWFAGGENSSYYLTKDSVAVFGDPKKSYIRIGLIQDTILALGAINVARITPENHIEDIYEVERTSDRAGPTMNWSKDHILYSYKNYLELLRYQNNRLWVLERQAGPQSEVCVDKSGRFWLCSKTNGAICLDNDRQDLSNPVTYLPGKKVTSMLEDRQGTFWFCTVNDGVYALPQYTPVTYNSKEFASLNFRTLAYNDQGEIFAGDDVGSVYVFKGTNVRKIDLCLPKTYNLVRKIIPYGAGAFWAATDNNLYLCKDGYQTIEKYNEGNSSKDISLLNNKVWLASATMLGYYDIPVPVKKTVIAGRRFTTVCVDRENTVWVGGFSGLYCIRDSFQYNWGERFPELKSKINALENAGDHKIWVATVKSGLLLITVDKGQVVAVEVVNKRLKEPIYNIQSVFADSGNRVWMATNKGIYGLDSMYVLSHFDEHDGLAANDVNSVLKYRDTLWVATVSGLSRLILHNAVDQGDFPTLIANLRYQMANQVIRRFHLADSIPVLREITVPSDATNLEMDLTGLDYRSRGNLRFEIIQSRRLLPWKWWTFGNWMDCLSDRRDTIWSETGMYSMGTLITPGGYKIRVTAVNLAGIRSKSPDSWTVLKLPYWYETVWIQLLLLFVLTYGIWRIVQTRIAYRQVRAAASALQLQALQSQLNPHFIGNAINAIQQFLHPPNPIKASEYISVFTRLLRRTMHFSEMTFITVEEELDYDREYLLLTELRFETRFFYEITGTDQIPAGTMIPAMLLQPVLENATLHGISPGGDSRLQLDFTFEQGRIIISITDNGLGYYETQRQKQELGRDRVSKGMLLLQKKIESLNALYDLQLKLSIQDLSDSDAAQHGTRITFSYLPEKIKQP